MNLKKRSFLKTTVPSSGQNLANFINNALTKADSNVNTDGQSCPVYNANLSNGVVFNTFHSAVVSFLLFDAGKFLSIGKNLSNQRFGIKWMNNIGHTAVGRNCYKSSR